ncbi:hydroxypyruvate isomerase [Rhodonellum psychrophilum GCM71 = DSM 17998]|uniref:Hydroxypyruvate isomerase n=2 Tax=Rhodonellum TaxID=336827 RepID=U5C4B6_9BACT|nr:MULTISPECIES: TIM barrel protein [Rhodonellum]ERM84664.1 hydroxypyruvate isomerase [Rhodonellum psychrophilum GCM71 = DSM 17998]SDZ13608.1 hydroxypyruvate isomerase [Rhodonellum ikkaensis]
MKKINEKESRRNTLKKIAGTTALTFLGASISQRIQASEDNMPQGLKGRINHSVCRWCYNDIELEDLCKAANEIGLTSIELVGPEEWPMLKKYGLTSAMPWGAGMGIEKGFNNPDFHDDLVKSYEEMIPKVAAAGFKQIICFSGNRKGLDDQKGIENCAMGLKRLMPTAEKHGVIMCMELLNSKVNHKDYQADHTAWGAEMCKAVGSENIKLLYDVYHMQIMEGDVIATINKFHPYISHYHTGGVPGRNEIDETQELYYPAIMKAILETGYKGFVGQEFIPKRPDKLASLKQGVEICDV